MVLQSGRLRISFSDPDVNGDLRAPGEAASPFTEHFTQSEEFFVRLATPIEVPSFAVHHDLSSPTPDERLTGAVRRVVRQIHAQNPSLLGGLTHLFDPANNQRPGFFRLYRLNDTTYLYLLQLDLTYRPRRATLVERTANVNTAHYGTRDLFLEADIFPLTEVETEGGRIRAMKLEQSISDTWIGETGRGYMRAGMWLDRDLTKFFSRVFVPADVQTYPYFPFTCKYRTVAHSLIDFSEDGRRRSVALLHRARSALLPNMRSIEDELRSVRQDGFNENLPTFVRIKRSLEADWRRTWERFAVRRYLNEEDEREFEVERGLF